MTVVSLLQMTLIICQRLTVSVLPKQIIYVKERESSKGLGKAASDECKTGMSKWIFKGNGKSKETIMEKEQCEPIYCEMSSTGSVTDNDCNPLWEKSSSIQANGRSAVEYESMIKVMKKNSSSLNRDSNQTNSIYDQYDRSSECQSFNCDYVNVPYQFYTGNCGRPVPSGQVETRRKSTGTTLSSHNWYDQYDERHTGRSENGYVNLSEQLFENFSGVGCDNGLQLATTGGQNAFEILSNESLNGKCDVPPGNTTEKNGPNSTRTDSSKNDQFADMINRANENSLERRIAFSYSDYEDDESDDDDYGYGDDDWDNYEDSR